MNVSEFIQKNSRFAFPLGLFLLLLSVGIPGSCSSQSADDNRLLPTVEVARDPSTYLQLNTAVFQTNGVSVGVHHLTPASPCEYEAEGDANRLKVILQANDDNYFRLEVAGFLPNDRQSLDVTMEDLSLNGSLNYANGDVLSASQINNELGISAHTTCRVDTYFRTDDTMAADVSCNDFYNLNEDPIQSYSVRAQFYCELTEDES